MLSPVLAYRRNLTFSFFFRLYINIKEYHPLWVFNLHYVSHRPTGKRVVLKYMHCRSLFWHAQFPSFIHSVLRRYQACAGCLSLFLWWHKFFFEHHFDWSKTFECVSYESSVATSTTTLLPGVINIRGWLPHRTPWVTARKTALLALFIEGLTPAPSSIPHLSRKGQSYSVLQAELLKKI